MMDNSCSLFSKSYNVSVKGIADSNISRAKAPCLISGLPAVVVKIIGDGNPLRLAFIEAANMELTAVGTTIQL